MGRERLLGMGGGGELDTFPLASFPSGPVMTSDCTRCMPGSGRGAWKMRNNDAECPQKPHSLLEIGKGGGDGKGTHCSMLPSTHQNCRHYWPTIKGRG